MPELPEVETVRRTLQDHVLGRVILEADVRETRMRYPVDAEVVRTRVGGAGVRGVRRRAKYLLFDLTNGSTLLVHLGMSGRLEVVASSTPLVTHDHLVLRLSDDRELRLNDPRRFGWVDAYPSEQESTHPRLRHLGLEPLSDRFTAQAMLEAAGASKRPIKSFLMDATIVVGVGNIYASEALFRAGIHPRRGAGRISPARWRGLVQALKHVLTEAIENGGTTLRDFVDAQGESGRYGGRLRVYGREGAPCPNDDGGIIKRTVMVGRSTYYCNRCQR